MSVIKRKTRMLSIRLSEDEYERLKQLCVSEGARSISDLTRSAVQRMLDPAAGQAPGGQLVERMQELDGMVRVLNQEVRRLSSLVDGAAASK